jgi:hypothetical protein
LLALDRWCPPGRRGVSSYATWSGPISAVEASGSSGVDQRLVWSDSTFLMIPAGGASFASLRIGASQRASKALSRAEAVGGRDLPSGVSLDNSPAFLDKTS